MHKRFSSESITIRLGRIARQFKHTKVGEVLAGEVYSKADTKKLTSKFCEE